MPASFASLRKIPDKRLVNQLLAHHSLQMMRAKTAAPTAKPGSTE
ncbi:hypothetical protein [Zooshikella harenae]|nr:hypothetical protein [Zooshikella harenae]